MTVSIRTLLLQSIFFKTRPTPILCRYHILYIMCFTENDVGDGNPVFSIGLTTTSDDVTLRDLLSKKLNETRSEVPFNEWSEEWKDKYPGKLFISFSCFLLD